MTSSRQLSESFGYQFLGSGMLKTRYSSFNSLFLYVLLILFHLVGIWLFTDGFFLIRYEVHDVSGCGSSPVPTDSNLVWNASLDRDSCWIPRRYSKAIILVIDALKFDYAVFNNSLGTQARFNQNKLPVIHRLLTQEPQNSLLFNFRADPPTVTAQRLKGLTTGKLQVVIIIVNYIHVIISSSLLQF